LLSVCALSLQAGPSNERLTPEARISILRQVAYEYATTLQPLPASQKEKEALLLDSSGHINEDHLRQMLANRGIAVPPGEVVQITDVEFKGNSILLEINGGGKKKKKWYQRIRVVASGPAGGGTVSPAPDQRSGEVRPPGSWILLSFNGAVPNLNAEELKKMLGGVLDFNTPSATIPWVETIPEEYKQAIEERRAVVGMDRKMVLAALGRPDRKVREIKDGAETIRPLSPSSPSSVTRWWR
jgi:hypothetical protein